MPPGTIHRRVVRLTSECAELMLQAGALADAAALLKDALRSAPVA
jgi:hypothetical protein